MLKFPINISWKVNFTHVESSSHIRWRESRSWRRRRRLILGRAFCVANDKRCLFVGWFAGLFVASSCCCCCCSSRLCLMGLQGSRGLHQHHPSATWRGRRRGFLERKPTPRMAYRFSITCPLRCAIRPSVCPEERHRGGGNFLHYLKVSSQMVDLGCVPPLTPL